MTIESIPQDVLKNLLMTKLSKASVAALSQTSHFFYDLVNNKNRKSSYIDELLFTTMQYDSNKLSLEKIEENVDFLSRLSSIEFGMIGLNYAIKNTEEEIKHLRESKNGDVLQKWHVPDQDGLTKRLQLQRDRLQYLNNFAVEKFGLYGQIYSLIYSIEHGDGKDKYKQALILLYLIRVAFENESHDDVINLLNKYNREMAETFEKNPNYTNYYLFLGKSETLISVDSHSKEIVIDGKPIDALINFVSQQALPIEKLSDIKYQMRKQADFYDRDYEEPNECEIAEIQNYAEFKNEVSKTCTEAEERAKKIMLELNKHTPRNSI
jgi:hypothetical protein